VALPLARGAREMAYLVRFKGCGMAKKKNVQLRALTGTERRVLASKLKDLSLSARVHQRYRIIEEVRKGHSLVEADRVGCHFTIAYDWAT
jgi:hypothetical protein